MIDIYNARKNVRKTGNYRFTDHGYPNILSMSDKKAHGSRRRMIAGRFADGIVRQFEPKMLHYIQAFCDRLYSCVAQHDSCNQMPWGPAMDMSQWFNYLTFDTMTEYIFGKKSNMLAKRKNLIKAGNEYLCLLVLHMSFKGCHFVRTYGEPDGRGLLNEDD